MRRPCLGDAVRLRISADESPRRRTEPGASRESAATMSGEVALLIDTARHLSEAQGGSLDAGTFEREAIDRHSWQMAVTLPATRLATVLVVDDNPDVAELFRRYLTELEFRVVQARTPPSALDLAGELHPDVIILDVMMPSKDGWQILQSLRADESLAHIPVIVCSILPEKLLALSMGVADFLAKPITRQDLISALVRCLGKRFPEARRGYPASSASFPQQ